MKYLLATLGLIFALSLGTQAKEIKPINSGITKVAIKGYDTVNYFTEKKPAKGSKEFSTSYMGATWHFKNQVHLDLFNASPEKYAPQYGGYCAYAVSQNDTAKIDPTQWTVLENRLYLNYNKKIQKKWNADRANYITLANVNWQKFKKKKPKN